MKIDLTELERKFWFEDWEGNIVDEYDPDAFVYRHCFPLTLYEEYDEYCYHSKNPIIKFLCQKSGKFYNWISKGKEKTFKPMFTAHTTYSSMSDVIIAMLNSGDYTLEQAVWICAKACERCSNALIYKYLDGKDGYAEYSDEWKKCNTVCDFCRDER
jgi:hypothetical protein